MSAIGLRRLGFIVAAFVLQTALLRAALPGPDEAPARPSLAGQLLVAAPGMGDPRFERTVILIVEHGPGGAIGIVINNPIGEQPLVSVFKALGQKDGDYGQRARLFGRPGPAGSRLRGTQSRLPSAGDRTSSSMRSKSAPGGSPRPTRPSSSTRTGTMFGMSPGSVAPSIVT
jgi:hypothetical protein